MDPKIISLLQAIAKGQKTPEQVMEELQFLPYKELASGLSLDIHRFFRTGRAEVIFAKGKNNDQLLLSVTELNNNNQPVLVTKTDKSQGELLLENFPSNGYFWQEAGLFTLGKKINLDYPWKQEGEILIITAGSSDLAIALEALGTAQFYDYDTGLITDVGVAGLHRITSHLQKLKQAKILIVIAGMEGALPSVLAGILNKPIIAVPTSIGYGVHYHGLSALLTMLGSCAPGISVVNIDNGFGAAATAVKTLDSFRSG